MKSPHILLASSNVSKLKANLKHLLDAKAQEALEQEIILNIKGLYQLGASHLGFAKSIPINEWRQIISRTYYGAYNIQRAVRLSENGTYSTDSTDHKKIGELPLDFPNSATYKIQLPVLRDDRNLCDYDHSAQQEDLVIAVPDTLDLVTRFADDARSYLAGRGVTAL